MYIEQNTVVSVSYNLSSKKAGQTQETVVEKTKEGEPFVFLFGGGGLIEGFETNLRGKKAGDKFDFHISPDKGYGDVLFDNIVNIPVNAFHNDKGKLDYEVVKVGNLVPMTDNQGHRMDGIVLEVTADYVRMDFNHPMAGHELHFIGEVLEIRNATPEEISHGHVHGPGGHHH